MNPPIISIRPTITMGRGVFAEKPFVEGEIIEVAPTISDNTTKFTGLTSKYLFGDITDPTRRVIAFGYASMYNHKKNPNARWILKPNETIEIKAFCDIAKDEEIFISYGSVYWKSTGIKPED